MQRQSLGSPSRERLVISTDDVVSRSDDQKRSESSPSSFSVADEIKPEKPHRSNLQSEKFIHFIPILVVLCFVILYLSSHDPSPQDLAQFHGLKNHKHPDEIIETNDIDEIGRDDNSNKELKRSGAFVIRSQRNLQEEIIQKDTPKAQSHRKLGDF